jgi:hypothetical protein
LELLKGSPFLGIAPPHLTFGFEVVLRYGEDSNLSASLAYSHAPFSSLLSASGSGSGQEEWGNGLVFLVGCSVGGYSCLDLEYLSMVEINFVFRGSNTVFPSLLLRLLIFSSSLASLNFYAPYSLSIYCSATENCCCIIFSFYFLSVLTALVLTFGGRVIS